MGGSSSIKGWVLPPWGRWSAELSRENMIMLLVYRTFFFCGHAQYIVSGHAQYIFISGSALMQT